MNDSALPSRARYRLLFFHSLLAFTIAFLLSTLIHEGAHAVTAKVLGLEGVVLHHNYVATPGDAESPAARLWVPASGPLASLVLGLAALAWVRTRTTASLVSLTVLWLGLKAFIGFFGYLMLGPMVAYGDTGRVYAALGLSPSVQWLLALAGLAVLVWLVRSTAVDFERHVPADLSVADRGRGPLANALIAFPIFAGVVLTTLLSLPVPTFISLLHPLTSPFVVFAAYGAFRRRTGSFSGSSLDSGRVSAALVATTLLLIVISRLLVAGLPLG